MKLRTLLVLAAVVVITPCVARAQAVARKLPGCTGVTAIVRVSSLSGPMA